MIYYLKGVVTSLQNLPLYSYITSIVISFAVITLGALSIYTRGGGGGLRHIQKGGLRHGHNRKRGVLGTGTTQKRGVLGTGTSRKRGVLRTGLVKKTILVTDVARKNCVLSVLQTFQRG